jgi:mediator of RNA polymerase II transcription subunit 6
MASKVPLLDEQDFNVPPLLQALEGQDINAANNLCWYFHSSQFFEPRCNNSAILNAHVNDPATNWILHNRKEFEQRMKTIDGGTRFVVAGEPQGEGQPWLYQRQNSVRNAEGQLESFVEGNWYNQGTRILMAPSMLDVVRARLVGSRHVREPQQLTSRSSPSQRVFSRSLRLRRI